MRRRHFLRSSTGLLGAGALSALASAPSFGAAAEGLLAAPPPLPPVAPADGRALPAFRVPELQPIIAAPDRIIVMNVCTRPFRAQGPRQESEKVGRKTLIHNYGHGGSGWSLSWGSAALAVDMALATGQKRLAVVGCGAIGMTTALVAQRAGLQVNIYTRELPPYVRSSYATGIWSPESRICTLAHAAPFAASWERQARESWRMYQNLLGLPGNPVEWRDVYQLSDLPFGQSPGNESHEPEYPDFVRELLGDLNPRPVLLEREQHPFPVAHARVAPLLHFNISAYSRLLLDDFRAAGGGIIVTTLTDNRDFRALDERTIINCTGYGARELLGDDSLIPVRGQTAKLIPQPEVNYGIRYGSKNVYVYPRRDGLLLQAGAETDFGNPNATIDRSESLTAVAKLNELMQGMRSAAAPRDEGSVPV